MKKETVITIIASVAGACLFALLRSFAADVPIGISSYNIAFEYGVLGFIAAAFGPLPAAATGFFGTLLSGIIGNGIWWSSVIAATVMGTFIGLCCKDLCVRDGRFDLKGALIYVIFCAIGALISWGLLRPAFDVLIYRLGDLGSLFLIGIISALITFLSSAVIGTVLCFITSFGKNKLTEYRYNKKNTKK